MTCSFFEENDEEQLTVSDLIATMERYLAHTGCEAYIKIYMKQKLIEHYGSPVIISGKEGNCDLITMRETADDIQR